MCHTLRRGQKFYLCLSLVTSQLYNPLEVACAPLIFVDRPTLIALVPTFSPEGSIFFFTKGSSWATESKNTKNQGSPWLTGRSKTWGPVWKSHYIRQWKSSLKFKHERSGKAEHFVYRGNLKTLQGRDHFSVPCLSHCLAPSFELIWPIGPSSIMSFPSCDLFQGGQIALAELHVTFFCVSENGG